MTTDLRQETPARSDERGVGDYLRGRLARHRTESPLPDVALHVRVIGERDELREAPLTPPPGRRVLPVHLYGRSVLVGPLTTVGAAGGACPQCVPVRWQKLRPGPERDTLEAGGVAAATRANPYLHPFSLEGVWQLVAGVLEADRDRPRSAGLPLVHELRLDTLRTVRYPILTDPACPACGNEPLTTAEAARLELRSQPKASADVYRVKSLRDYDSVELGRAAANPVCGMLGTGSLPDLTCTTTAPVTGYMFVRGAGGGLYDFFWSGHGDSYDDSYLLAVLEGMERYSGLRGRPLAASKIARYADIAEHALDPRDCGVYGDEFYRATAPYFVPFTDDLELPWVWGHSLRDDRPLLVPERLVYYMGRDDGANFVQECSNGCASGGCLEEAILYGLLELIERDAFLIGWYGKVPLPEIDTATCNDRATRIMIERIRLQGYDVRLFDNRISFAVPVVTGVAVRRDEGLGTLCFAAGAGLDPDDAARAALCEIASYLPTFEGRTRNQYDHAKAMAADYFACKELHDHPLLFGLPEMAPAADFLLRDGPKHSMTELYADWNASRPRTLDLLDDLRCVTDMVVGEGYDVIAANQTAPEQHALGVRTACVLAPGLLPIDFGWTKQRALYMPRLRTALRRAGLRGADLDVADLHLVPHPFP